MDAFTVIALTGAAGSGKTNFIRLVTGRSGNEGPQVEHDMDPYRARETKAYECEIEERRFLLLDTPSFSDTHHGDAAVLKAIRTGLSTPYQEDPSINCVIHLHQITQVRVSSGHNTNLNMLRALCGVGASGNVILATTFWDQLSNDRQGEAKEQELFESNDLWSAMRGEGSKTMRFRNTRQSAIAIVLEAAGFPPTKLRVESEMLGQRLSFGETSAGIPFTCELEDIKKKDKHIIEMMLQQKEKERVEEKKKACLQAVEKIKEKLDALKEEKVEVQIDGRPGPRRRSVSPSWLDEERHDMIVGKSRQRSPVRSSAGDTSISSVRPIMSKLAAPLTRHQQQLRYPMDAMLPQPKLPESTLGQAPEITLIKGHRIQALLP